MGRLCGGGGGGVGLYRTTGYIVHYKRLIMSAMIVGPVHCILNVPAGARDRPGMYVTERGRARRTTLKTFRCQQTRFIRYFSVPPSLATFLFNTTLVSIQTNTYTIVCSDGKHRLVPGHTSGILSYDLFIVRKHYRMILEITPL